MTKRNKFLVLVFGIIFITIFTFIVTFVSQKPDVLPDFEPIVKEITRNTKLIDVNYDHNQALDVIDYAKSKNISIPKIIINFDTHSDLYLNFPVAILESAGVENWINEYIARNPEVEELYWVLPNEEVHLINLQTFFAEDDLRDIKNAVPMFGNSINTKLNWFYFVFNPLDKKSFEQTYLIDPQTGVLNEYIEGNPALKYLFDPNKKYKKVKVVSCTKETLPDFKGQKVFLSIDADYTSNSGFDTTDNFKFVKSEENIDKTFYSIFETVKNKNIEPEIISLSLSPQYLPQKRHAHVMNFFNYFINLSGKRDEIDKYTREYYY